MVTLYSIVLIINFFYTTQAAEGPRPTNFPAITVLEDEEIVSGEVPLSPPCLTGSLFPPIDGTKPNRKNTPPPSEFFTSSQKPARPRSNTLPSLCQPTPQRRFSLSTLSAAASTHSSADLQRPNSPFYGFPKSPSEEMFEFMQVTSPDLVKLELHTNALFRAMQDLQSTLKAKKERLHAALQKKKIEEATAAATALPQAAALKPKHTRRHSVMFGATSKKFVANDPKQDIKNFIAFCEMLQDTLIRAQLEIGG